MVQRWPERSGGDNPSRDGHADGHPSGEQLSSYVDGELDMDTRARVDRHVRACAACRAKVGDYRSASDLFRRVPTERPPLSLRRDIYRRIDEDQTRRRPLFGFPLPSANVLGVAVSFLLIAIMTPQLVGLWSIVSGKQERASEHVAPPRETPGLAPTAPAAPPLPTVTAPAVAPTTAPTQPPAPTTTGVPAASPTAPPAATITAASAAPTVVPSVATAQPAGQPSSAPVASARVAQATPATQSGQAPAAATTAPAAPTVIVQPTATQVAAALRTIAGQVTNVNKPQRLLTVQTGSNAEGGSRAWNVALTEGTQVTFRDGRKLVADEVGFADYVEVSGFEVGSGPLQAASVKVTQSAVAQVQSRPKVLVLLDGAANVRAPQYGFTGDWIKRLGETGYDVTAADPATLSGTTGLKDFSLIAIGYPATLPDAVLQNVRSSKLPVLNAEPRLVQALGLGLNVDPAQPTRSVAGRTVEVAGQSSPVARGFNGDTVLSGDQGLYRTPIVSNGTVLATVTEGGQKRAVWSVTGNAMYHGFWYSANGQNHNAAYWTLFDRSVLLLLGKDPLAAPSLATPAPTRPPAR